MGCCWIRKWQRLWVVYENKQTREVRRYELEEVNMFVYLGANIYSKGDSTEEIN